MVEWYGCSLEELNLNIWEELSSYILKTIKSVAGGICLEHQYSDGGFHQNNRLEASRESSPRPQILSGHVRLVRNNYYI